MPDDIDRDVNVASRANAESAWTFGTLFLHFNNRFIGMENRAIEARQEADRRYEQRWAAQEEAVKSAFILREKVLQAAVTATRDAGVEADRRYEQRWLAQEHAISAALASQEKAVTAAMISAKEAVLKAETANEKRFESVNEFRGTLSDQATKLIPRIEVDSRLSAINEKISAISTRIDRTEGKGAGMAALWGIVVAGFGLVSVVIGIVAVLTRH